MEQGRGFLVYLSQTYTSMVPYLKGIHLTWLDSWREGRDDDAWKLRANARRKLDEMDEERSKALNTSFVVKDWLWAPLIKGVHEPPTVHCHSVY